ncbi:glycerophosphoryl diester phosphodiesterase membrane domain-containing protein [Microbacterium sp.]|uniref:glycerophosphoryl diester phosphodiesterase membrane domain-containing protein n=1 Tax=Microbacterium sp. TaxID=51671 RepID=UPI0039E6BFB6
MTAFPTWTPAARPGIVPLHPLTFGTILGRSFVALRQNPRVLLGFALVVQTVGTIVAAAGIVAAGVFSFARLATLQPGTEDFETVMAGAIALTSIVGIVLSLAASALGILVQGVVVGEVAHAIVAEKQTLRALWARVRPVAGRLVGYTLLVTLIGTVALGAVTAVVVAVAVAAGAWAVLIVVVVLIVAVPLLLWLSVKLLLVPSVIVLEGAGITTGIARSWTLTRGRFWPILGIVVVITLVFGVLTQVANVPFMFLTTGLSTIFAPTGEPDATALIGIVVGAVLTEIVMMLIQSIGLIVQSTASALIYADCRMRREGLDLDLLAYVDRRDAGQTELPDPYRLHIGRETAPRWARPAPAGVPATPSAPAEPAAQPVPTQTPPDPPAATEWTAPGTR